MRTIIEYRVISERDGCTPTVKKYRSVRGMQARLGRLTSPEPWRFWGSARDRQREGNSFYCCDGYDCGCGGETLKQHCDAERKDLPPMKCISVDQRVMTTTAWSACDAVTVLGLRQAVDAVDPSEDSNTGKPTTRA